MTSLGWTTADYALIVSLCSAAIALFSLGWNVWSKFIYPKARLEVSIGRFVTIASDEADRLAMIVLTAVNHGPTDTTVNLIIARTPKWHSFISRQFAQGIITHWNNQHDSHLLPPINLPASVKVGEETKFYFPETVTWFGGGKNLQIGLVDVFGRYYWVSKKQMAKLKSDLESKPE